MWKRVDPRRYRRDNPGRLHDRSLLLIPICTFALLLAMSLTVTPPWSWLAIPIALTAPTLIWVDLDSHRLPDHYTAPIALLPLLGLSALAISQHDPAPLAHGLIAAAATACVLLIAILLGSGTGAGDVKLLTGLTLLGGAAGWHVLIPQLILGVVLNGLIAASLLLFTSARARSHMPLGPGILIAWLCVYLARM